MEENARPPLQTLEEAARMIDLALVAPHLSDDDVARGCETARRYGVRSVTLRAADVQLASKWLEGSGVLPVAAIAYPHGAATTAVKNYEVRDALQRGARGVEAVVSLGKLRSRSFQYLELEISQMVTECRRAGATVTLDLELPALAAEDLRIIAAKIARRTEVDRVRAASLYCPGTVTAADFEWLRARMPDHVVVDAGPASELAHLLAAYEAGASGVQTVDAAAILDAWREELKRRQNAAAS